MLWCTVIILVRGCPLAYSAVVAEIRVVSL